MISIITPVYNAEPYLKTCIESVQAQDYTDWEWILVDDGSTDSSPVVLADYASKDARIHIFSQQNKGCASARNRALDEVHGEYVTFLDSDDWMEEGTLTRIQKICETENPDQILWNYHRFENGVFVPTKLPFPPIGMLDEDARKRYELDLIYRMEKQQRQYAPFIWIRAIKSSIIKENGIRFDTNLRRSEDTLFSITIQRYCRTMYVLDDLCVVYRVNPSSISHTYVKNYMQGLDRIYEDILSYASETNQPEMKQRAYYMYVYRTLFALREEVKYKRFTKALSSIREIMKSRNLQDSLREIGKSGAETFGRRYLFLYRKKTLLLYFLLKTKK